MLRSSATCDYIGIAQGTTMREEVEVAAEVEDMAPMVQMQMETREVEDMGHQNMHKVEQLVAGTLESLFCHGVSENIKFLNDQIDEDFSDINPKV